MGKTIPAIGCLALCILSFDANAWGLATHVHFAQSLTWAIPLSIPALSIAVRRFPAWVLAGACLPDLALFGRRCGTRAFDRNHQWRTARRLLDGAHSVAGPPWLSADGRGNALAVWAQASDTQSTQFPSRDIAFSRFSRSAPAAA